jgi:ribonucleoside-diphosphate reductase alpha chain
MIETVVKRDGTEEAFDAGKLNKWAEFATEQGGDWSEIARQTFKKLPAKCTSKDIHQTMIDVCLSKQTIEYSRVASRLELAELRKAMNYLLNIDPFDNSFKDIMQTYEDLNIWDSGVMPEYNPEWENWYNELKEYRMEFWRIKQWTDKYSQQLDDNPVETPALGYMGIALALFGDSEKAYEFAKGLTLGKISLPTPALNGLRNGDWDTISCCVISADDTTESIGVANWIAYRMTAKKAGIGIEYTTRSKGDNVKGGRVKHLGKHPIYKCLDREVKVLTQITRGGNATVTALAIDPEIEDIILWRSQRKDIETRIDKLDNEFGYNDAFVDAVVGNKDWHLFSYGDAPDVYKAFYKANVEDYNKVVDEHIKRGVKHKTVKARDLLKTFLTVRQETGRFYDNNLTRTNTHTPFIDTIKQSNL